MLRGDREHIYPVSPRAFIKLYRHFPSLVVGILNLLKLWEPTTRRLS